MFKFVISSHFFLSFQVMQLNGHGALAVLLTGVCNIVGILTIPTLLKWLLFQNLSVSFNIPALLLKLSLTMLLPPIVSLDILFIFSYFRDA